MPAGVANPLSGNSRMLAESRFRSPIVRKVSLTGSDKVGKYRQHLAADGVKDVSMEPGGDESILVFPMPTR